MAYSYQLSSENFVIKLDEINIMPAQKLIVLNFRKVNTSSYDTERATVVIAGTDFIAFTTLNPAQYGTMYDAIKQSVWSYIVNTPGVLANIVLGRPLLEGESLPTFTEIA